jgi:hypothetical protein
MILAAAAVAAVTTVSAQNMKAEIPFPFQAVGARMQPGTYSLRFSNSGAAAVLSIYNEDTRKSILALPRVATSPARPTYVNPVLTFACTDNHCVLSSLKNEQSTVYTFPGGKTSPGTRMATIALRSDRME